MLGAIRLAKKRISAHFPAIISIFEWFIISVLIAVCVGSAIALFLVSLEKVTDFRVENSDIIYLLPLAGLLIGYVFKRWGKEVNPGNNLIIENIHNPKRVIPFRMAPFILLGTVVTHLFGGSAGREGTAIQIGGAISDQFTKLLKLNKEKRKMILISGMSAGFGAVFGTPIAGAIFGLEVYHIGKLRYNAIFPAFTSAIIADYVTRWFGIHHTHYQLGNVPAVDVELILFTILAGVAFGLASLLFSKATEKISHLGKKFVKQSYYRPVIGGVVVLAITALLGTHKYLGLGTPTIVEAFTVQQSPEVFFLKIMFTAITLGCGFKGGEVTPLFFIGAALGSALSLILPLPVGLMAAMGFVAVFAGASNTPLASSIMAIELFGLECSSYVVIACVTAYLVSGHNGIYSSQIIGDPKSLLQSHETGKHLHEIK